MEFEWDDGCCALSLRKLEYAVDIHGFMQQGHVLSPKL